MSVAEFQVLSTNTHPIWNGDGPRDVLAKNEGRFRAIGRFGAHEVEVAAWKLVTYLSTLGPNWSSFTLTEAVAYYQAQGWDPNIMFYGLSGCWSKTHPIGPDSVYRGKELLVLDEAGYYSVTSVFVEHCLQ